MPSPHRSRFVLAFGVSPAVADPDPANNQNALVRTLPCDNGETIVASFAGLEGSNFNVTTDERVFVYTWIHIDRTPASAPRVKQHSAVRAAAAPVKRGPISSGYRVYLKVNRYASHLRRRFRCYGARS